MRRIKMRRAWLWGIELFFFALSVQWMYLEQIKNSPFFDVPIVDAKSYMDQAVRIARGEVVEKPFWQPPLYPYFLGSVSKDGDIHRRMASIYAEKGEHDRARDAMRAYQLYRHRREGEQMFKAMADNLLNKMGRR